MNKITRRTKSFFRWLFLFPIGYGWGIPFGILCLGGIYILHIFHCTNVELPLGILLGISSFIVWLFWTFFRRSYRAAWNSSNKWVTHVCFTTFVILLYLCGGIFMLDAIPFVLNKNLANMNAVDFLRKTFFHDLIEYRIVFAGVAVVHLMYATVCWLRIEVVQDILFNVFEFFLQREIGIKKKKKLPAQIFAGIKALLSNWLLPNIPESLVRHLKFGTFPIKAWSFWVNIPCVVEKVLFNDELTSSFSSQYAEFLKNNMKVLRLYWESGLCKKSSKYACGNHFTDFLFCRLEYLTFINREKISEIKLEDSERELSYYNKISNTANGLTEREQQKRLENIRFIIETRKSQIVIAQIEEDYEEAVNISERIIDEVGRQDLPEEWGELYFLQARTFANYSFYKRSSPLAKSWQNVNVSDDSRIFDFNDFEIVDDSDEEDDLENYEPRGNTVNENMEKEESLSAEKPDEDTDTGKNNEKIANLLRQSIKAYRSAMEVFTKTDFPEKWALAQMECGDVLREQGELVGGEPGIALIQEGIAALRQSLQIYTKEKFPAEWAMANEGLVVALEAQAKLEKDDTGKSEHTIKECEECIDLLLTFYAPTKYPHKYKVIQEFRTALRTPQETKN